MAPPLVHYPWLALPMIVPQTCTMLPPVPREIPSIARLQAVSPTNKSLPPTKALQKRTGLLQAWLCMALLTTAFLTEVHPAAALPFMDQAYLAPPHKVPACTARQCRIPTTCKTRA
mmetsp:Transcript_25033/g.43753  ORF Transcript_25033/g.43753 Transcript_25033/m.43753 type:complete len:116 (-) Transcript_25033:317-664(-)